MRYRDHLGDAAGHDNSEHGAHSSNDFINMMNQVAHDAQKATHDLRAFVDQANTSTANAISGLQGQLNNMGTEVRTVANNVTDIGKMLTAMKETMETLNDKIGTLGQEVDRSAKRPKADQSTASPAQLV